jgi:hypothetical protein
MLVVQETEKAKLLEYDGIRFWVQKRWQKRDGTLTPAGKKAMAIAMDSGRRHWDFDARKAFEVVRETEKALLLRGRVTPAAAPTPVKESVEFWIPRSMAADYRFMARKVKEIERDFPFSGMKVMWR